MTNSTMARRSVIALSLLCAALNSSSAQTANDVVGSYTLVSFTNQEGEKKTESYGPAPKGMMILDANQKYVVVLMRSDLPKFASNNRRTGTAEEYKAVATGSFTHFGSYTVTDGHIIFRLEKTTFPNWDGQEQKRALTITGDELKYAVASSIGGTSTVVWRRIK